MIRYKRSHFIHNFALKRRAKWKENYNFHLEKKRCCHNISSVFLLLVWAHYSFLCSAKQRINYSEQEIKYSNKLFFFSRSIFKLAELSMKVLLSSIIWNENLYMNMYTDCMNIACGTNRFGVWKLRFQIITLSEKHFRVFVREEN